MNVELYMLDKLKARVQLARQIDVAQHKVKKEKHEKNWLKETADAMGIELDSDFADRYARPRPVCLPVFEPRQPPSDEETKRTGPTKRQKRATDTRIKDQKLQLKQLLIQPLLAQGVSKRYVTSGSNPIAHELLAGESESTICRCGDQTCAQWKYSLWQVTESCSVSRKLPLGPTCQGGRPRGAARKSTSMRSGVDSARLCRSLNYH